MAQRQHDECRIGRGYAVGQRMPKKARKKLLLGSRTALLTVSAVRPEISQGSLEKSCNVLFCGFRGSTAGLSVDEWLPTALGTVLRAASWAAAHHERRALCSHADAEAVGRGFGSPRPRIPDAAVALCATPRGSCYDVIFLRAHHRFHWGLMAHVRCCSRSTEVALCKPARM